MNLFFHFGALGDFVLTLPMLRRLDGPTTAVSDWPRAVLASKLIPDVKPMDIQLWEFMRLYAKGGPTSVSPAVDELFTEAQNIISFVSTGSDDWAANIERLAPQAKRIYIDPRPPENFGRHLGEWLIQQAQDQGLELAPPTQPAFAGDKNGPIVIHPGSGGEHKCWPAERYESLIEKLNKRGQAVRPLLGEAEAERWPDEVIQRWQQKHGAEVFGSLDQLHAALAAGSAYIGNDSGPTHLAAQMGLPTIAIFGPTPPALWAPIGPSVAVLAPPTPAAMDWLSVDAVLDACPLQAGSNK